MFNSQDKQDEYLEQNIFKGHKKGFFVDVGAHDGKSINNTLYFETTHNWTGINIEPIKDVYDQLEINRPKCINLNCAIDEKKGQSEFIYNKGYTEMISGLKSHYDPRHYDRLECENNYFGSTSNVINVATDTLTNIFNKYVIKHVNYLSIDVEGAEFAVIKSINFDNVFIDVIGFENNYNDTSLPIIEYLKTKGYLILHKTMDIFMIHEKSLFR